jgi:hypothetical protein
VIFGGASPLFALIPLVGIFVGGLLGIAAIVLGIIGIFKSHRLMAIIGIALAVVGLVVAMIVTFAAGRAVEEFVDDYPTGTDESAPRDETTDSGDDPGGDGSADGTSPDSPFPAGTVVDTENWKVAIGEVMRDATEVVLAEDEFNTPPPEGQQYFMFEVEATYQGDASGFAYWDLTFGVYMEATVYTSQCGLIPDDLSLANEVYPGGVSTGNYCVTVPTAGVEGALITIEDFYASEVTRYFVSPE